MKIAIRNICAFTLLALMMIVMTFSIFAMNITYKITNPKVRTIIQNPKDYDLAYEEVEFYNLVDGISLSGWWIPAKKMDFEAQKAVIFAHGYGYNRADMPFKPLKLAKRLHAEGYDIFMFDFRNSGLSEKAPTTIGRMEKEDLLSAIHFVANEKKVDNIALIGWSMGAVTSILAGAESENVRAVIADSPFADLASYSKESFQYWTGLPQFLASFITIITEFTVPDFRVQDVKPVLAANNYSPDKGLFLIHSKKDGVIPYVESKEINKKSSNSELWLTPKGGHIRSYYHFSQEYEEKIIQFLDQYFEGGLNIFDHFFRV